MADDIASLIHMNAGEPSLAAGQNTILPEGPTVPTTAEQLNKHMGVQPAPQAAPQQPVQQAPAAPVTPQLAAQPKASPGLTVTATGNNAAPGSVIQTSAVTSSVFTAPKPAVQPAAPVQTQAPAPVQQPAMQPSSEDVTDDFWVPVEDAWGTVVDTTEDIDEEPVSHPAPPVAAAPTQPAPSTKAPAPAAPDPVQRAVEATAPKPAVNTQGQQRFAGDDELEKTEQTMKWITEQCEHALYHMGCTLLNNPQAIDQTSAIHKAIHAVRWQPDSLPTYGPHALVSMEHVLTAHQVWVQSQENFWQAKFVLLGKEIDRIMYIKRDNYSAPTNSESENKVLATEPRVRELRNQYLLAQAMSTLLKGMGERFAQLEDGIKRTINLVVDEHTRQRIQANRC